MMSGLRILVSYSPEIYLVRSKYDHLMNILATGILKIQINDGQMMDLVNQSNTDFEIRNEAQFTYVTTWFGVDVTFERRKPGKMMLIKTYLQPFWQTRVQVTV